MALLSFVSALFVKYPNAANRLESMVDGAYGYIVSPPSVQRRHQRLPLSYL